MEHARGLLRMLNEYEADYAVANAALDLVLEEVDEAHDTLTEIVEEIAGAPAATLKGVVAKIEFVQSADMSASSKKLLVASVFEDILALNDGVSRFAHT